MQLHVKYHDSEENYMPNLTLIELKFKIALAMCIFN